jgi:hexosaminidase
VADLQPWVTRHFVTYLAKKGRRAIGWDEIFVDSADQRGGGARLTSLLPKSTLGMCWRMEGAGAHAANACYEIVRCPTSHCYFDYRQGLAEDPFTYLGGMLPLARVYAFDPLAGVSDAARANVIGGQCCNWTSHTWNRYDLEWKLWPRGFALAEILWTYPDPAARDFAAFAVRAGEYRRRLIRAHVNCAPLR